MSWLGTTSPLMTTETASILLLAVALACGAFLGRDIEDQATRLFSSLLGGFGLWVVMAASIENSPAWIAVFFAACLPLAVGPKEAK